MTTPHLPARFALLEFVRRRNASTRSALGQLTGLSRSVVAQVVSELVEEGLLTDDRSETVPGARGGGRPGRPSTVVRLAPQQTFAAGIDIGHRHISVAVSELDGRVLHQQTVRHEVDAHAGRAFGVARGLLDDAIAEIGLRERRLAAVGVSLPFPVIGPARTVAPVGDTPAWTGARPRDLLRLAPGTQLVIDNDADAGAWGELMVDDSVRSLLFVKVGDGVGSSLAVEGKVLHGAHSMAGEIGHVPVAGSRLDCRCGNTGCLDAVVTRAIHPDAGADEVALAAEALGRTLAQLASFADPDVVVLGGIVGNNDGPLRTEIIAAYEDLASRIHQAPLRTAALGRHAELRGALDRALCQAWAALAAPATYSLAR